MANKFNLPIYMTSTAYHFNMQWFHQDNGCSSVNQTVTIRFYNAQFPIQLYRSSQNTLTLDPCSLFLSVGKVLWV